MTFSDGTRLDGSRVQRRGRGGRRGAAAGGGIGALLIALLVYIFFPDAADDLLGSEPAPGGTDDAAYQADYEARCVDGDSANDYADCRVLAVVESLDVYWERTLPTAGVGLDLPGVVVFDDSTSSACGMATSATGPFYCPLDQTMYVDTTFFDTLAQFGYEDGNLAEAYIVAHEYGHHIQNQLGIFDIADRSQTGADSDTVRVELMSDCLAGMWVGSAAVVPDPDTGIPFLEPLTDAQLRNALAAAASVGDDRIQEAVRGEAQPHTFTHGTSQQRQDAFVVGYNEGSLAACDAFGVVR